MKANSNRSMIGFLFMTVCIAISCSLPDLGRKNILPDASETVISDLTRTAVISSVQTMTAVSPQISQTPYVSPTAVVIHDSPTSPATMTPWVITATSQPATMTPWVITATPGVVTATPQHNNVVPVTLQRSSSFVASYMNTPPVIDGVWDEWTTPQMPIGYVIYGAANRTGDADLDASYRIGWDYNNLYLAVKVKDDKYVSNASGADLYKGDGIELLLDFNLTGDFYLTYLTPDDYQLGLSVNDPVNPTIKKAYLYFPREVAGDVGVNMAYVGQDGLYRMEAAIPWSVFGLKPYSGMRFGFALRVSDNDDPGQNVQQSMISNVPGNVLGNPTTWGEITFK